MNLARSPLLAALVGRKKTVVRHQLFPQKPPSYTCLNVLGYQLSHLLHHVAILPVVTKDLAISPRFSPTIVDGDASSALLHLVNQ